MSKRLISLREAAEKTSYSKAHLYRLIHRGVFPRPVPIGPKRVALVESEVDTWIEQCVAERDG